jgi:hypothetical protein
MIDVKTYSEPIERFKIIDTYLLEDEPRLSCKAKLILIYILSRPPGWRLNMTDLTNRATDGESSIRSGINELVKYGYLFRMVQRDEKRRIVRWGNFAVHKPHKIDRVATLVKKLNQGWELHQFNKDQDNELLSEDLLRENHEVDNQAHNNNDSTNTKKSLNKTETTSSTEEDCCSSACRESPSTKAVELRLRPRALMKRKQSSITPQSASETSLLPPKARAILKHWEDKGFHISKVGTKSRARDFAKAKALVNGTAFNRTAFTHLKNCKIPFGNITEAIDRFTLSAFNPDFFPDPASQYKKDLQKIPFHEFVYTSYSKNGTGKSKLEHYLNNEPKKLERKKMPWEELKEDKNPVITRLLREKYMDKLKQLGEKLELTPAEENMFIDAAAKTVDFFKKHDDRITSYNPIGKGQQARYVWEAIARKRKLSEIVPATFVNKYLYTRDLVSYLEELEIMEPLEHDQQDELMETLY